MAPTFPAVVESAVAGLFVEFPEGCFSVGGARAEWLRRGRDSERWEEEKGEGYGVEAEVIEWKGWGSQKNRKMVCRRDGRC